MGNDERPKQKLPFDCANEIDVYKCKTCPSFETNLLASLKDHLRGGHKSESSEEDIYECLRCHLVTSSNYLMGRHSYFSQCATRDEDARKERFVHYRSDQSCLCLQLKDKPGTSLHNQPECPSVMETKSNLKKCDSTSALNFLQEKFECEHCALILKTKSAYKDHVRYCSTQLLDIQWFTCDICSVSFGREENLNSHIRLLHSKPRGVKWFKCGQCPSKFKTKGPLERHLIMCHSKPEDSGSPNSHLRLLHSKPMHTRSLKCGQCLSEYKTNGNLKRHVIMRHSKPEDGASLINSDWRNSKLTLF